MNPIFIWVAVILLMLAWSAWRERQRRRAVQKFFASIRDRRPPPMHPNCRCAYVPIEPVVEWQTVMDDRTRKAHDELTGSPPSFEPRRFRRPEPGRIVKVELAMPGRELGGGYGWPIHSGPILSGITIFVDCEGVIWDSREHPDATELPDELLRSVNPSIGTPSNTENVDPADYKYNSFSWRILVEGDQEYVDFFREYLAGV